MKKEILKRRRINWYDKVFIKYQLIQAMKGREVIIMDRVEHWKCFRGNFITNMDFLDYCLDFIDFFNSDRNIYISVAKYRSIPSFTYNLSKRSEETIEFFTNEMHNQVYEYDMLLDFDCKNKEDWLQMYKQVCNFVVILDLEKICYYIIPSGNNFHIVIPSGVFNFDRIFKSLQNTNEECYNMKILSLTEVIKKRFCLKYLDMKGIGILNKIMKCPYSLVYDSVVLPLNSIEKFDYYSMNSTSVIRNYSLMNRGLKLKNDFGELINKKYMNKFIKKYELL